jgi:hypothetical protein
LGAKVMKMELNYLASKKWGKVGRQELLSTPFEQEINPWSQFFKAFIFSPHDKITNIS